MLDYFVPEVNMTNESAIHQQIRELTKKPIDTDDKPFSREEILPVIKKNFNPIKLPGLTSEITLHIFRRFPSFLTEVYNKCLKEGYFPKQ